MKNLMGKLRLGTGTLALAVVILLPGCANTQVALTNPGKKYPKTENVELLVKEPSRPYEVVAILDSVGSPGISEMVVLNDMRERAKGVGADAILLIGSGTGQTQQQLLYNPLLGGYQTLGGEQYPKLRGAAIKYVSPTSASPRSILTDENGPSVVRGLEGRWSGAIRSSATGQTLRGTVMVESSGRLLYLGSNGVRIDGQLIETGAQVKGQGIMYMPTDGQGRPMGRFPDGSTEAEVQITGIITGTAMFSGVYTGGGDTGALDLAR